MAHFAKLDENNKVIEVYVVNNAALDSENEQSSGEEFLNTLFNTNAKWVQTSYNSRFRYNYAGQGFFYDPEADAFIAPSPNCHPELILNTDTYRWTCENADHFKVL